MMGRARSDSGEGGLAHETGERGQGRPSISQVDKGFAPQPAIHRQALEVPVLEGSIAGCRSVAGSMVDPFPGAGACGQVAHQTEGAIGETFPQVEDFAIGMSRRLVGTLVRRLEDSSQGDPGLDAVETSVTTGPLVSLAVGIEAVGGEGITEGTNGTAPVVIAAHWPLGLVLVGGVGPEVDHAFGAGSQSGAAPGQSRKGAQVAGSSRSSQPRYT